MPELVIGARTIPYEVRRSGRARRKRIEVSPAGVEVIAPDGTTIDEVERFVDAKRRWVHDKTEEVREKLEALRRRTPPEGYHSGAKVLFRGRYLRLRIESAPVDRPSLTYRTAFHVRVPAGWPERDRAATAHSLIREWCEERMTEDAWAVVRSRGEPHGLVPRGIRFRDQKTLWGSCGKDGIVRLDRKLVRLPKPVLEYVVVHELCHLRERSHSRAFWELVKAVLPDYGERKGWLERYGVEVE